jgi:hypothetical protein
MSDNDRILVLVAAGRTKRYPLPAGYELKDEYDIDGTRWTVTAVLTSEDVPIQTEAHVP